MLSRLLAIGLVSLCATHALAQQQREYDDFPDVEVLRSLLLDPEDVDTRNIYTPGGDSLVNRPAQKPTKPKPSQTANTAAKPTKPKKTQKYTPRACATYGEGRYVNVRVQFALNSARVQQRYHKSLGRLAQVMMEATDMKLSILGHTDVSGGDGINQPLSEDRAAAIAQILVEDYGIDAQRIVTEGRSSSELCYPNLPYAAANRRVTFQSIN